MPPGTDDVSFEEAFRASDAERRTAGVPDDMPIEYVRERCEKIEKILRLQFAPDPLPQHFQAELARCSSDTPEDLVERWVTLSHLLRCWRDDLTGWGKAGPPDEEKRELMRQLLTREPVTVDLAHRTVEVTDRSFAALQAIARHYLRVLELQDDLEGIQDRREELREELQEEDDDRDERDDLRVRLHELREEADLRVKEIELQRRALYAHLFTEDGAPASSPDEAPEWWDEIGPVDEVLLIQAAHEAGPRRLNGLGEPPERPDQEKEPRRLEDFGWMSVLAGFGMDAPENPAEPFQRPLAREVALRRAGADPVWED